MTHPRLTFRRVRGLGSTEMVLLVVLIGIAAVLVVTVFGRRVANLEKRATSALDGDRAPRDLPAMTDSPPADPLPASPDGAPSAPSNAAPAGGAPAGGNSKTAAPAAGIDPSGRGLMNQAVDRSGALDVAPPVASGPAAAAGAPAAPVTPEPRRTPVAPAVPSPSAGLLTANAVSTLRGDIAPVHGGTVTNPPGAAYRERYLRARQTAPPPTRGGRAEVLADTLFNRLAWEGTTEDLIETLSDIPPGDRRAVEDAFNARFQAASGGADFRTQLRDKLANNKDIRLAYQILDAPGAVLSRRAAREQMAQAVRNYESATGKKVRSTRPSRFNVYAIRDLELHLSSYGAQFTTGLASNVPQEHYTGFEYRLKTAIEERVARNGGRKLTPGDVFEESLRLHQGDVYQALLGAHNLLRAIARGADPGLENQGPVEKLHAPQADGTKKLILQSNFGSNRDDRWLDQNLVDIHGGVHDEEGGSWYHMFGTATSAHAVGEAITNLGVRFGEQGVYEDYTSGDPLKARIDYLGSDFGARVGK